MSNQQNEPPAGAWETQGQDFDINSGKIKGRLNNGAGAVDTANQILYGDIKFYPYKYIGNDPDYDYHAFVGSMNHGVTGFQKNGLSVGYYATEMRLKVTCLTERGSIYDYGPVSTVGEHTVGFNIGGGLSVGFEGKTPTGSASVNAGWSVSFSSPDVTFESTDSGEAISWICKLPFVGFVSPGNPVDPKEPSFAGYQWKPTLIVKVPKDKPPLLEISVGIFWQFDYTRGITNDVKSWQDTYTYNYQSVVPKQDGALLKGSNPEIYVMESGNRRLIPDPPTFEAKGFKWENVNIISDDKLKSIPLGTPIFSILLLKDGVLLKGSTPEVYVMELGTRRFIPDPSTFEAKGFKWGDIKTIPDAELKNIPLGSPL